MKNKRLLILLIAFFGVAIVVTLGSTLFTVNANNIEVNWTTTRNQLRDVTDEAIIEGAQMRGFESIFFVNKTRYVENLEQNFPYIKVLSIETVFPNRLVFHVGEREALYALRVTATTNQGIGAPTHSFVLLCREFKVLEHVSANQFDANSSNTPILLETNQGFSDLSFTPGMVAAILFDNDIMPTFSLILEALGQSNAESRAYVRSVVLSAGNPRSALNITMHRGIDFRIVISDAENRLFDQLLLGFSVFEQEWNRGNHTGVITVYVHSSGEVRSAYNPAG